MHANRVQPSITVSVKLQQPAYRRLGIAASSRHPICMTRNLKGLQDLPRHYQGILLDQFGVLHDGQTPYPAAVPAVEWLHEQGLKILILSNSSKRSHNALQRIQQLGYEATWFDGAITSGEVTHAQLADRPTAKLKQLGSKCLHFTWKSRGAVSLEGLDLKVVENPADAEFILAHGTEALGQPDGVPPQAASMQDIKALLQGCAKQQMPPPMVVANPDVVTVSGSDLIVMPGTLAEYYAGMGGKLQAISGMPSADLLDGKARSCVLAIGDSLQHDIQGACSAGVDSLFITGGIHAKDIAADNGETDEQKLLELFQTHKGQPTYTMEALQI